MQAASGFELMWRSPEGWALLSERGDTGGVAVEFDGSSALVGGLPEHLERFWFAVRARNTSGMSQWSPSFEITVPLSAVIPLDADPVFDPFTAPTRSNIDLERLGEAAATITPGQTDCDAAPSFDITGITIVDQPAGLDDPDAELTVAEIVRIAGGCLLVEYVDLDGRTVAQVRELLAAETTVFAVDEPVRGLSVDHPTPPGNPTDPQPDPVPHPAHSGDHYDDSGCCEQWHLPPDITGVPKEDPPGIVELDPTTGRPVLVDGLWQEWDTDNPVTVAVLDTGVDVRHPDLANQLASGSPGGCHSKDPDGHGTHVAGIVAAEAGNGMHTAGVAPDARILPLRVLERGSCTNSSAALAPLLPPAAIAVAVNRGARVINMSLSGTREHDMGGLEAGGIEIPEANTYELVLRAASMLGVVTVVAAGNCGDNRDEDRDEDVNGSTQKVTKKKWDWDGCDAHNVERLPAIFSKVYDGKEYVDGDVIAVAAINHGGSRRLSSTANKLVDIAAPGGEILSTVVCASQGPPNSPPICETDEKSGTSMAAPFVAGVVAHMLNRYPQATPGQVRDALQESAGGNGRDDEFGHGIVQPIAAVAALGNILAVQSLDGPVGGFRSVVAGGRFSCGVSGNWRVRCWGDQGVVDSVPAGQAFSQVSVPVGDVRVGCGLRPLGTGDERGTVLCLSDMSGQVLEFVPQGAFTELAVGQLSTCGLRPAGGVVCWNNQTGERVLAVPSGEFTEISGGWEHWCGLREDGTAVCWGDNSHGQTDVVAGSPPFSGISAGGKHTCAVTYLSGVRCWGDAAAIAGVPDTLGFRSVDSGFEHTCAIQNESMDLRPIRRRPSPCVGGLMVTGKLMCLMSRTGKKLTCLIWGLWRCRRGGGIRVGW